jgi:hypothetical protein
VSGCCSERGCTRSQPFLILQSPLSGRYYLVTRYDSGGAGVGMVGRRHDITEQVEALLQREAKLDASAVIDAVLAEWPHRECGGMVEFDDAYLPAVKAGKSKTIADKLGAKALLDAFAAEVKQRLAT